MGESPTSSRETVDSDATIGEVFGSPEFDKLRHFAHETDPVPEDPFFRQAFRSVLQDPRVLTVDIMYEVVEDV